MSYLSIIRAIILHSRAPYFCLHAHHTSSFLLWHTSSFERAVALPSCFVTHLPSFSTYLFHLPHPSASSTDVKELPTSLHHCRFIAVASLLSLLHCHNITTSRRYLGKCNGHQKHHVIFLEPNRGVQKVEQILTWEGSLPFL